MNEQPRGANAVDDLYDPELACRYREAAREAPPQTLDDEILKAARREAGGRPRAFEPQPEVTAVADTHRGQRPPLAQRGWRLPLALAAVVIMSVSIVAVSPDIRDSVPREEQVLPQTLADGQGTRTTSPRSPVAPESRKPLPRQAMEPSRSAPAQSPPEPGPHENVPEARAAKAPAQAQRRDEASYDPKLEAQGLGASAARAEADTVPPPAVLARQYADEPPEKWGEKILELRRQGRAGEADALLAEFRRRYPDHAVPREWTH